MNKSKLFSYLAVGATAGVVGISSAAAEKTPKRPNILFIPVDDLKPLLGCYGDKTAITPNIDRLAKRGLVFLNAQCQQAICGPTRASIMTGLYPDTTRVYDLKTKMRDMNPDVLTLPQYFKNNGYETTGIGKTYDSRCVDSALDKPSWSIPYKKGVAKYNPDYPRPFIGYQNPETKKIARKVMQELRKAENGKNKNAGVKSFSKTPGSRPPTECFDIPDDSYRDGATANSVMEIMEELAKGEKPFFLSVGFLKPHLPFVAPKKYWDLYDRSKLAVSPFQDMPKNGIQMAFQPGWELRGQYSDIPKDKKLPKKLQLELIHGYYACVSYVDAQVGKLLDKLDELGIADNTIICLWGDHGWHLGDHSMWCKHSNFEQAVRVPLIISVPNMKAKGKTTNSVVGFIDVFPTLCQLADLPIPKQLQGLSLVPILNDPEASVKEVQMSQYPRYYERKKYMGYTLRSKTHRYVAWIKEDKLKDKNIPNTPDFEELYDYTKDPLEKENIAQKSENSKLINYFHQKLMECMKKGGME